MKTKVIVILLILISVLAGCTQPQAPKENIKLKVLTWNVKGFNDLYGNFFRATHLNYDLDVISLTDYLTPGGGDAVNKAIEQIISTENPDIISLNIDTYSFMLEQGKLASLSPFIKKNKFDTSDFTPSVLDYFTDNQNQIHGLTATFNGTALYYNKKLFSENGIPFPEDSMTWDEIFLLAQRFPNFSDDNVRQYGYNDKYANIPFLMALYLGESNGLSFYNDQRFIFSSKSWENVFQQVTDCFKSKTCYEKDPLESSSPSNKNSFEKSIYPFLEGNIAMSINESTLNSILTTNKDRYPNLDWGIVSMPVGVEHKGISNSITINDIFSIPINAGQAEDAWEFIEYVSGPNYAKLLPSVNPDALPARVSSEWSDPALEPFYKIDHITSTTVNTFRTLPALVLKNMDEIPNKYMADITSSKTTVAEALKAMESELQASLESVGE